MSVSVYKLKKWIKMISGKSISHVNQGAGKCYSIDELKGYYNDLTEKVIKRNINDNSVPMSTVDSGKEIFFPIEIFQYGLGAYDLYLLNNDNTMLEKAIACADWAINNQNECGGWVCFDHENVEKPYSSMAQGEAISLLCRIYKSTNDDKYLKTAEKAIRFMLESLENGGTTKYDDNDIFFFEYTYSGLVLNGWIFSIWGVYDYYLLTKDSIIKELYQNSINTLKKSLKKFSLSYWSFYDLEGRITSPFYHKLHIAQLEIMYNLTSEEIFLEYAKKWGNYYQNRLFRIRAFIKKAIQKIVEK